MRLPAGTFHDSYVTDQAWWQTRFVWARMLLLFAVLFIGIPILLPLIDASMGRYVLGLSNNIGYFILGAMGVQLLIGFAGQITLGHMAFIAVGAYTSAIAMLNFGLPYPLTLVLAALVAGLWSVLFGLPSARVKGYYLIMTTMAAQFITVDFVITQYVAQIGGRGQAFSLPGGMITFFGIPLDNDLNSYYLMVVLVLVCFFGVANLLRTRVGRAWFAIRDNDIAAQVLGVNIVRYKLLAYFVAGALGGIAGAYWLTNLPAVSPENFVWSNSLELVGAVLIGGVGSLYGVVFGSLYWVLVREGLQFLVAGLQPLFPNVNLIFKISSLREAAFGLSIIVFLLFEPKGLAYRWNQIKAYIHLWPFSY